MTQHKPTDEQAAVLDAARTQPDCSLMITADAGCAKSTTLIMLGPVVKGGVLGLAFNKSTAQAMQGKMPGNFSWKTANGLGHGAWIRANPGVDKWTVDDKKLGKLVTQISKDQKSELTSDQWDQTRQLVQSAMQTGLTPDNIGRPLVEDTADTWERLAQLCWITQDDRDLLIDLAKRVLNESIWLSRKGTISFDDQIYCSVCLGGRFTQFAEVMTDESQDLNPLNHQMIALSTRRDGRLIAVGDPKQSIYAFRGASTDSMERIRALKEQWIDLPLHVTFRCPKVIVERQQGHAPGFKAFHSNPQGAFLDLPDGDEIDLAERTWGWKDIRDALPSPEASIAIGCRNNAPLMKMAFKLIRRRIAPMMLGRALGKNLVSFSKKVLPDDETKSVDCAALLTEWMDKERALAIANGKDHEVEPLEDRIECLRAVLSDAEVKDAGSLRQVTTQLFAREAGQVILGTGHKLKGTEHDVVIHIDPWRIPSRQAKEAEKRGDFGPLQQDRNIGYVIETRTKHTLINANLEDFS